MQDLLVSEVDGWKSQLKKGTLELAVLALLHGKSSYGLELLQRLRNLNFELSEGSIYPLLARLRQEKKVAARWVDESSGHAHKYYSLTKAGQQSLGKMKVAWHDHARSISAVMDENLGCEESTNE